MSFAISESREKGILCNQETTEEGKLYFLGN